MAGTEIGFGLVGTGMIARYHADAIAQTPGARPRIDMVACSKACGI